MSFGHTQWRPDEVYKTGVVQPFNVVSQSPVYDARHYIDPFVQAIRPEGAVMAPGNLGIVSPEVIRTLSLGGFGADPVAVPYAQYVTAVAYGERFAAQRWYFLLGGVVGGLVAGFVAAKVLR